MVLHMPWNCNLGGARVQIELADEFRAMGHQVEKFAYNDAFPNALPSRLAALTRPSFSGKAKEFVKKNSHRFDIIDAHQGNLPFSKQELGFDGLLVARSVGLYTFYDRFADLEKKKWPQSKRGSLGGDFLRFWTRRREAPHYPRSLQTCDLINLPNHDELAYVSDAMGLGSKSVVLPFGLSKERQLAFVEAAKPAIFRLANKQVVFIGSWGPRKGSRDWAEIIKQTRAKVPEVSFLFLGTGLDADQIFRDLNLPTCDWIKVISHYNCEDLPKLLSGATVGAFPSYIEGFGFAVLEKLASGLPTVAYDVPGPREMLKLFDPSRMVPVGRVEEFSSQIVKLLELDEVSYSQHSHYCTDVAKKFSWRKIAEKTIDVYSDLLE